MVDMVIIVFDITRFINFISIVIVNMVILGIIKCVVKYDILCGCKIKLSTKLI
jgi:hypothetical protein